MEKLKKLQRKMENNANPAINAIQRPSNYNLSSLDNLANYASLTESVKAKIPDLICFSHLRWDFVYQRPQHLLSRCAKDRRVFFVEEPIFGETAPRLEIDQRKCGVWVAVPHLPHGLSQEEVEAAQQSLLLDDLILERNCSEYVFWFYTPMALGFVRQFEPMAVIYDCMDELSAFKNPPPKLKEREAELLERADVVFTGGFSLYEAKRHRHANIFPFPSSIEVEHFLQARQGIQEPADQANIPHPRLGFYGVIDERMDLELLDGIAKARPDWQIVMVGPVVKIDPADLPKPANIHYLGGKAYEELPAYLSGWDIAMLPFARNESTQYISPTKTPEYLAAGVPVVATRVGGTPEAITHGEHGLLVEPKDPEGLAAAVISILKDSVLAARLGRQGRERMVTEFSFEAVVRRTEGIYRELLAEKTAHRA
jgi:UDP-galactopyranose mutase